MNTLRSTYTGMAILLLGMLHSLPAWSDEGKLSLTTGFDYSAGKYGGNSEVVIRYVPITLKYARNQSTLKLTVPYLSVTAPGGSTIVDGEGNVIVSGAGASTTRDGLGDVVATYSFSMTPQPYHGFLLDVGGKVKFATADAAAGLGSGENDYILTADAYRLAGRWTPFLTLAYRMPGDPPGMVLRDTWGATLGAVYKHNNENSLGLMWEGRQSTRAGRVSPSELMFFWTHKMTDRFRLQTYAVAGLSNASPDYGLGGMLTLRY